MFSQASVILFTGGLCGEGVVCVARMHGAVYMAGGHAWQLGTWVVGEGHAWQGACMAGGMCNGGHVWQGACIVGVHMIGGVHGRGHAWWGGGMHGGWCAWQRGHAWQERRPLQRTVCILLERILVNIKFHLCCFSWDFCTLDKSQRRL